MMNTTAFNASDGYRFVVHLDTTKVIPDPTLPPPEEGAQDTRPLVPDPAWVCQWTWGKEPPEGVTTQDYLLACKREAELLAGEELAKRQPPEEIVLPI